MATSRRVRLPESKLARGQRSLSEASSRYLVRVHRLRAGDAFVVFDPEARLVADATLLEAHPREARAELGEPRAVTPSASPPITLVQALGKGDTVDRVLRDATQLGVTRVVLANTERAVVRVADALPKKRERWREIVLQAARQCGRGDVPEVLGPSPLAEVLDLLKDEEMLLLDPRAEVTLYGVLEERRARQALRGRVVLVGPEGGFSASELELCLQAGATAARLGPHVLRLETAAVAVLGALLAFDESERTLVR